LKKHRFFRQPRLAPAINKNWQRLAWEILFIPFDRELRIEATRLRQSEFSLGIVPLHGLTRRQIGVGKIGPEPCVNCSLKLRKRRVKPTQASLGSAQQIMQAALAAADRVPNLQQIACPTAAPRPLASLRNGARDGTQLRLRHERLRC
jgi:hypothetical protein